MSLIGRALDCAPLHLRPLYRLARHQLYSLTVVSASGGVEFAISVKNRPSILVVRDDGAPGRASPFLDRENTQRDLGTREIVSLFSREPTPFEIGDLSAYVLLFEVGGAVIETCPDRFAGWCEYIRAADPGDMSLVTYEAGA